MRKIVKLLLVGLLAITLVACGSETVDAASIYENARANMEGLDSYTMETAMVMTISAESDDGTVEELSMTSDMTYILVDLSSDSPSAYHSYSVSIDEEESTIEYWLIDGVLYIINDENKYTQEAGDADASSVDLLTFIDEAEDMTATSNEDGYTLEIVVEGSVFLEIMTAMNSETDLFSDATVEEDVTFTVEINGDGYITAVSVAASIELTDAGTLTVSSDVTYYDFDSSSLPDIDTDSFTTGLTTDNADDVIAAGYEDMGDNIYSNGTYIIDLELQQIYSADGVYDWEYDQGAIFDEDLNIACGYDFASGTGDEDCDVSVIETLRDVYNELASSILE